MINNKIYKKNSFFFGSAKMNNSSKNNIPSCKCTKIIYFKSQSKYLKNF